jgi:hypothetical protein
MTDAFTELQVEIGWAQGYIAKVWTEDDPLQQKLAKARERLASGIRNIGELAVIRSDIDYTIGRAEAIEDDLLIEHLEAAKEYIADLAEAIAVS